VKAASKTVLFLDDDAQFLEVLQGLARERKRGEWEVLSAQTTAMALALLQSQKVDLAVIDLRMPVVDGMQFLQLVHRQYPQMKKVILSAFVEEAWRRNAAQAGAEMVIEKPVSPEGYDSVLAALTELLRVQPAEGFHGVLHKVGIEDVLQMECLSRHSLVLEVGSSEVSGRIFIKRGEIVHAEAGGLAGEAAFERLILLKGGEFNHLPFTEPPERTVNGPWEFLLMEAVRKRDEASADAQGMETVAEGVAAPLPMVVEMVICTESGELLQEWQSPSAANRCAVLTLLRETARRLEGVLPVGMLERVEFFGGGERAVARLSPQGGIFVRGTVEHE
jgi:CheY-like chemotaxis protein